MPGVMADQRKALTDTAELTDTVYFVHPISGSELSTLGSASRNTAFLQYANWIRQNKRAGPNT